MNDRKFAETVNRIVAEDPRFATEAYEFISDTITYTAKKMKKTCEKGTKRHITGQELLDGIREHALNEFGPLAFEVLRSWGIKNSMCVGNVVFNMVDNNLLGAAKNDTIGEFKEGFDFKKAFSSPFSPENKNDNDLPVII